jgi:aminopeptidase N
VANLAVKARVNVRLPRLFLWTIGAVNACIGAVDPTLAPGVPEILARERAEVILSLRYELSFAIPDKRSEAVRGSETIRFALRAPHRVVLDFAQPRDRVRGVRAGDKAVEADFAPGHLTIPASATKAGENAIRIEFLAGNDSLNRNDDFLYTLFVPARAHFAWPCLDQPDLKARYSLTLDVPSGWEVVANGAEMERAASGETTKVRFAETQPIPTYLFAFAAGKFRIETAQRNGRTFRMFHRETDERKVARNRDAIFDLHSRALAWLEEYTGIPYPWGKFDFVLIPSFQFGGMEHPGAIFYNAASLLLDESATQNQLLGRANTISHETSHMWFGDLVTMRWFNDVWMKEVMANFLAAKIVNPSFPEINHDLRFLLLHYPSAYAIDRTSGANPIRQKLANLDEAGVLYGAIIYDKAPVVVRQLEMILGGQGFRDGMREYLKRYSFANATWPDLVKLLGARTPENLGAWSHAWVDLRGRPEMTTHLRLDPYGNISALTVTQRDPMGRGTLWPQRLQVTIGYVDHAETVAVSVHDAVTSVGSARGRKHPLYVLPNGGGVGYGMFVLDGQTRRYLAGHIEEIPDALTRGSAWVDLWDNVLWDKVEARLAGGGFLDLAARALPKETDEQNTQLMLSYLSRAFWLLLPPQDRIARAPVLEAMLRQGIARARTSSQKSTWFNTFRDVALTADGLMWLERVWRREQKIEGLTFAETDEITMALELAVREVPGWQQILDAQRDRTQNPDRKSEFEFVMPALSADATVRDQAFERFRKLENRRREPWVLQSMHYLNHPLREQYALRFVAPSLELLPEIQPTGDIFFPERWMASVLSGHRSPAAAQAVRDFLARHPNLPERLRWTVLSSADDLFRAAR